jgi:hypothetical protein
MVSHGRASGALPPHLVQMWIHFYRVETEAGTNVAPLPRHPSRSLSLFILHSPLPPFIFPFLIRSSLTWVYLHSLQIEPVRAALPHRWAAWRRLVAWPRGAAVELWRAGGHERINASGLEGVNRPAKQTQPISANFCPDPGTFGLFPGTSGKMHLGVFCWSF